VFELHRPCSNCPFRKGQGELYQLDLDHIVNADAFQCHKTVDYKNWDDPKLRPGEDPQQCAGLMSLLSREGQPSTIMQVGERLGAFDPLKLVHTDVYASLNDAYLAHGCPRKETRRVVPPAEPPRISGVFTPPNRHRSQPAVPVKEEPAPPPTEWKLVPVIPTEQMLRAGFAVTPLERCWHKMLEYTPAPPEESNLKKALDDQHHEEALRGARHQMLHLRKFLAEALCCICGERLGEDDNDILSDDEDRTVHKHCEEAAGPPEIE
jgi:hypothetical protein